MDSQVNKQLIIDMELCDDTSYAPITITLNKITDKKSKLLEHLISQEDKHHSKDGQYVIFLENATVWIMD